MPVCGLFGGTPLCDSEAAGVSSDGGVWVMCRPGSAAVPQSVAAGWVTDVEEARVEPVRPRSREQMLHFD
jgi:hypothetical protein